MLYNPLGIQRIDDDDEGKDDDVDIDDDDNDDDDDDGDGDCFVKELGFICPSLSLK